MANEITEEIRDLLDWSTRDAQARAQSVTEWASRELQETASDITRFLDEHASAIVTRQVNMIQHELDRVSRDCKALATTTADVRHVSQLLEHHERRIDTALLAIGQKCELSARSATEELSEAITALLKRVQTLEQLQRAGGQPTNGQAPPWVELLSKSNAPESTKEAIAILARAIEVLDRRTPRYDAAMDAVTRQLGTLAAPAIYASDRRRKEEIVKELGTWTFAHLPAYEIFFPGLGDGLDPEIHQVDGLTKPTDREATVVKGVECWGLRQRSSNNVVYKAVVRIA